MDEYQREYEMQRNLQREQLDTQQAMNAYAMADQAHHVQAAILSQTNPLSILEKMEMDLRGLRELPDGNVAKVSEPKLNDKGIGRMLVLASAIINQNTILSHLEKDEISKLIVRLDEDLVDDLVINWKEYDVKDKIMLDHIVDIIVIPAFLALKRAYKQNEKNWLNKIVIENLSSAGRQPQKKEGFMDKFRL